MCYNLFLMLDSLETHARRSGTAFRSPVILGLLAIAGILGVGCKSPSPKTLESVRFAVLTPGVSTAVLEFARDSGLFRKSGIDVQLRYFFGGGNEGNVAIAGGQIDLGSYGPPVYTAIVRGLKIRILAATSRPAHKGSILVGRPEIKRVEDLRGKVIATTTKSMSPYQQVQTILAAHGMSETDFVLQPANGGSGFPLLKSGQAQATLLSELDLSLAEKGGFGHALDTSGKYLKDYQSSFIFGHQDFLRKKPEVAKAFVRTFFEARRFARDHFEDFQAYAREKYGKKYDSLAFRRTLLESQKDWGDGSVDTGAVRTYLRYMVGWGDFKKIEIDTLQDRTLFDLRFLPGN
jgi:ABC-type nitrate/sulfonate/bicarbonate transport system substrate-binding protein